MMGPEVTLRVSNCSFSPPEACSFQETLFPKANYASIFFFNLTKMFFGNSKAYEKQECKKVRILQWVFQA